MRENYILEDLFDADEAIDFYRSDDRNDAEKAYAIGVMANEMTNRQVRAATGIDKVYSATHYIRIGKNLSREQLEYWHSNIEIFKRKSAPEAWVNRKPFNLITLGHMRTIASLPVDTIDETMKWVEETENSYKKPVSIAALKLKTKDLLMTKSDKDSMKEYVNYLEETTGRSIDITYRKDTETGTITLSYYKLSDLEFICEAIGAPIKNEDADYELE